MQKTKDKFYSLKCFTCKNEFDEKETCTSCLKCGDPLQVELDFERVKKSLNLYSLKTAPISHAKYLSLMPIKDLSKMITLNEGGTPLLKARNLSKKFGIKNLYFKNEGANPTGVFKDRGTVIEVTKAIEIGAKAICLASTGNMAASVAAYCAIAKIPCYILIPEGTPLGKLSQTLAFGARVLQIRGDYSTCMRLAEEMSKKYNFYLAGDYVFRLEGAKTLAYEIVEQLLWKVPDYVICPVGCGTNLSAIWKGFKEFYKLELIDKLPKIIGVQTENCQVVVKAFEDKTMNFTPVEKVDTVCSAIAVSDPLDGKKVLKGIFDSKGCAVSVKDTLALEAVKMLANEESIFMEPSGALGVAAIQKLNEKNYFKPSDTVVVIGTGNGLKDSANILKTVVNPPACEPNMEDIDNFIKNKLWSIKPKGKDAETLWKKTPNLIELKNTIKKEFGTNLSEDFLGFVLAEIKAFEAKGKRITKPNLKSIIEDEMNQFTLKEKVLKVIDFDASTSLKNKAKAKIKAELSGKKFVSNGEGVGAFDAIIVALKKGIKKLGGIDVTLTDFNVIIDSGGADAVVKVSMTLMSKEQSVVANAASPDVIAASLRAFEKGFNLLHNKINK